jgi:uncharacterized protein YkwD
MNAGRLARLAAAALVTVGTFGAVTGVAAADPIPSAFESRYLPKLPWISGPNALLEYFRRHPIMLAPAPTSCSELERTYGDADPTATNMPLLAQTIACIVNDARVAHGVPALAIDTTMTTYAQSRTDDMANRHYFAHVPTNPYGENIYYGSGHWGRPNEVVNGTCGWMNEPLPAECGPGRYMGTGHRDNILNRAYTKTGVGGSFGDAGQLYSGGIYAQEFIW